MARVGLLHQRKIMFIMREKGYRKHTEKYNTVRTECILRLALK